jgi:ABC-type uncharacterized transport system substrate-binding protein
LKVIISSGNAYKDNCVPGFTVPSLSRKGARDMPQQQNTKIPIVFEVGVDPVDSELVTSLSRPGGNLTGVGLLNAELGPKRLELLYELVPRATIVAVLVNPTNPNSETL